MTTLPPTTKSRLQKIAQVPGVWEGDRRPLGSMASHLDSARDLDEECVIWVDGSEGAVRAMDVVTEDMGIEAISRTLLRAIESPHHPGKPHRPQKIIVRDREIQFFLRGVLQGLDISIEYAPELPIIDLLFSGFAEDDDANSLALPARYEDSLKTVSHKIWQNAPWELLADSDILQVELKNCEIERVYLCIMGMMSEEYGVLIYRSLDSLKQFRGAALGDKKSASELEQAFLAQDCWFLNYEELELEDEDLPNLTTIEPFFGSLHPFEGMRPFLDETEAKIIYAVLESLVRFCQANSQRLAAEPIPALAKSCRIALPKAATGKQTVSELISTKVTSLPDLTEELLSLGTEDCSDDRDNFKVPIQDDLIPEGTLISLSGVAEATIKLVQNQSKTYYQSLKDVPQNQELPTILIQTSRPKAKELIDKIKNTGGLKSVCFNSGQDPLSGESYELGMLQTGNNELHVFAEYSQAIAKQATTVEKWQKKCQQSRGFCNLVVAMGITGTNRGKPQLKDILALFELKSISGAELGMGVLQLMPDLDF